MIFDNGIKVIQWGEENLFNKFEFEYLNIHTFEYSYTHKKMNLNNYLMFYTKINWHDHKPDILAKTKKLLGQNLGENLYKFWFEKIFLD